MAEETKETKKVISKEKKPKKKKKKRKILLKISIVFLLLVVIGWFTIGMKVMKLRAEAKDLVANTSEQTFKATQTSVVYDTNGKVITKLKGEKDVYYLKYKDLPVYAVAAMISVEDNNFYKHNGVDFRGIARAAVSFVTNKGEVTQGGSTITQQLARTVFLTREISWQRKVKEMFVAWGLEKEYSKDQIMEFYLNNVYFANGYYGIQAASKGYFDKDAKDLTMSEAAFLCAVPNAPNMYEPYHHKEKTLTRRDKILKDMYKQNLITKSQRDEALREKITLKKKKTEQKRNYIETYVIHSATKALMEKQGFEFRYVFDSDEDKQDYDEKYNKSYAECKRTLYSAGYQIHTSIDLNAQKELQSSIDNALSGYTEKDKNKVYKVQGAGVCIDNETGKVAAIVGGRYQKNAGLGLNRAYQSPRQPGSAIKPILVYAPAMERGYGPGSIVNDNPMNPKDKHRVRNSGGSYSGSITLRRALEKSSNVATMRLYEEIGPKSALRYLEKMNFKSLDENDYKYYTTCLGGFTYGTTAEEMASGYAALANQGVFRDPTCIVKIEDSDGETVVSNPSKKRTVYSANTASMMSSVLKSVITNGTGRGAKVPNVDTAGKQVLQQTTRTAGSADIPLTTQLQCG